MADSLEHPRRSDGAGTPIPDWLPGYLATRDAERREAADKALAGLTDRERALVREAAVMGFVRGRMSGLAHDDEHPRDSAVLFEVVSCCQSMSDRFPLLGAQA